MAPSRITTFLPIFIFFCLHIQQSSQQACWEDIPIKTENKENCKECPGESDKAGALLMERVEKLSQVKFDLNCMVADTAGWAGTVQTHPWLCKVPAKDCTERLGAYNWTSLADKAAKEALITRVDGDFKLIEAEVLRLKSCAPKKLCPSWKSSKSLVDSRKEAQKMASALNCATDTAGGGIDVKGYKFKLPVGVPFVLTSCTKVVNLYSGTNIRTEAFVNETSAKLNKLLKELYKSSFCNSNYLCPCGDVQLSAKITSLVKSVKCTNASVVIASVTTLLAELDKLLKDSKFSYTEACAANEKPSDKPDDVRTAIIQVTEALRSMKIAKELCPCLAKRQDGKDKTRQIIEAWAQDATCANKALTDKTAAETSMDAIKKVTDALEITTDASKCTAGTLTDAQRNSKIQTLAGRITQFSQKLDLLGKCPCSDEHPEIDKNAIKSAKFEADCWFKKIKPPSNNLDAEKTKIDELIKKLRKDWHIEENGKNDKDMDNQSECRKSKETVDDAAALKKLTEIYTDLEELSKQAKMLHDCPCKVWATEDTVWLFGKIESLAKDATCNNKDLTNKTSAKANLDAIKKITDELFMTVTEAGCPAPSGDDASRLSNIQKLAARIPTHNAQYLATWNCPCGKLGVSCPCKVSLVKSAIEKYREVEELSNEAYCVDPNMDTSADATVKTAWANIVPIYGTYYLKISKMCGTPDAAAAAATPADKVKAITAIENQLKDLRPTIKTYEDAIVAADPLGLLFEKVYKRSQMKGELNCIAAELKKLTQGWTGTVTNFPWLCSTQTSDCTVALAKNKWSTLANATKPTVLTKLDGEYKTLINEIVLQTSCLGYYACSSGKAQLETRTTAQMQADATKMASALKCATDTANGGITVAGYTFSQPVAVPALKSCADATNDYNGTDIKTQTFVQDTDAKLQTLLKDFYDVSFCRKEGLCQCGNEEMTVNIDNLVKSVKCTDATKENPGAVKRMEALDIALHSYDYKYTQICTGGKKPSDKPNKINFVIERLPKMIPIWRFLGQQCPCQEEKVNARSGTERVIKILAQEATCLNKALTVKTGAQTKMAEVKKVTDALKQTITETPCTAAIAGIDAEKTATITTLADRITALFSGCNNMDICPCSVELEFAAIKNFAKTQLRKTNCAEQNLAKPAEATEFKTAKGKIDALAKQYCGEAESSQTCEKVTTTDAALTTEVKRIATDLEALVKNAAVLKECPCKSSKEMKDIKVYNRIQSLAQEAVCINKELTDKAPAKTKIVAIKAVTDALLMTVTETGCTASTGTAAEKLAKITNIASRVSLNNNVLDWVRKCPCKPSDKTELKLCRDKNSVIIELLDELEHLKKILEKANCIVPDWATADATVKAITDFTTCADKYVIQAGNTCPPGFTPPTVAAEQVKALTLLQVKLKDVEDEIEFYEESFLAKDCSVSQFYQKYNRQIQLKTAMNCVVLELKKLNPPWGGAISSNNWLCEKAAKDCPEWLAKYQFATKDNATKTAVLTTLETEYNKIEKQMELLDESTKKRRCMRGTQFLVSNTAGELYNELQKMQSALKCATDAANGGVTVVGYTWAEIQAIPFLITPCSKVTTAYTGTNITTDAFVKDTNTKLQAALKTYLEVYACRLEGACSCGNDAMQAKLTGITRAVKCTGANTTNAVAMAGLKSFDKLLKCNSFPYAVKCAKDEKPSIVVEDVDNAIESAEHILPKWGFFNDFCPCKSEGKESMDQLTRIIESEAKAATCYNKELTNKATAQPKMTEIKTVTDALGLTITETGCTASTLTDAKRLEAITKLAASVTQWDSRMATVKTCPCEELEGTTMKEVKDVLSRFKKTADCRQADLNTASDAGFKVQKDKIDALAKKYEIDAADKPDCVSDTTSTDAQLTTTVTDIFANMEKLTAILDQGQTCPCKLKAANRDLKLYSLIEAQANLAACNYQNLTNKAPVHAKMGEITAITEALFMKITATNCANATGDDSSVAAIKEAAERVTIHNTQFQNGRSCPCPVEDKNECPCKLEKVNSAMDGYKSIGELVKKAKCIERSATNITDNDLATAVGEVDQYSERYGVKASEKCSSTSTADAEANTEEINKIGAELKQLVHKIEQLEDCPCPDESVILKTASEKKLSEYFYGVKCIGEKYKTDASVSAAVEEIDTIIAAQLVAYKTDCAGFTLPPTALDAANATNLIGEQETLIESEIGKLDKIDKCRGLPDACRAGLRPLKVELNSTRPMDIVSPGWSDDKEGKLCSVRCLWNIIWSKQLEVTYAAEAIDIKANADKTCGDNKLCLKVGGENKTDHCTGQDVLPKLATEEPLLVSYINKGAKDCGKGFKMSLKPSYAGCGKKSRIYEVQKPDNIEISSPNDDGKYPDNLDCKYEVRYDPQFYMCSYSIGSLDINSTDSKICAEDVLNVTDSGNTTAICGTNAVPETPAKGGKVMLNFVSDAEGSGTGFTALFTCKLKYPKACDPNATEPEVINITSATIITDVRSFNPIEGNYMKNAMCRWKVCWDPRKFKVEYKTVGDFDIKTNNSCQQDRLVISNETDSSNVSACTTSAIAATQVQVEANSTEACLSVNFTANGDAEVGGGFQVLITSAYDVPLHCDSGKAGKQPPVAVANTEPIYLSTWGYEHGFNYLANQTCIWPQFTWDQQRCTIGYETVGVMSIYQTVNDTTCETDYIEVTTGAGNTTKYCGGDAIPLTNVTDSNSLSVKFVTDSATNTTGKGCKIKVQCQKRELSKGCFYPDEDEDVAEYELTEPSNGISFTSVDRLKNLKYIPGYKCSWKVKYDNEKLDLLVSTKGKFDLKTGADCTKDTLTIKEGANGTDECVKGPISTRRLVKENETEVNHTSNNDNEVGEGFELVFLPVPKGCGGKPVKKELQTDENLSFYGQIENRTVNYAPDLNCNWEYEWDKDLFDVSYKIENVNIKGTPAKTCDKGDKLVLDDGKVTNNVCGTANVTLTPVQTGTLKIQFTSDPDAQTGSGFNLILVVTFKACVAGAKTPIKLDKPDKHEIDFYGEGYPESLSCEWNYQWDTAVYDVQFCFPKIEVTGSMPACAQDKIDTMDGQTKKALCGAAAVSCITADSGNLTIGFISDAIKAADGKGFEMVIKVSYQACTNAKKEIVTELTKPGTHVLKFYNPEKYHKDLNCTYTFKWNLQSLTVKQKLLNMDIDASTKNCSNASTDDYLERSDGKNAIRVCGNATDLLKKPLELKTGFASYNFISNADGNNGRGFIVEFEITKRVLPKACRDGDSMTIKLPGNTTLESLDRDQNLPYLSDLNCSTTLKHDPKRLRLSLTTVGAVDINSPNAKCENDSLVIQDGEKGNATKHCQKTKIETPIELESGHTVIAFHSDGANEGKGYSVVVAAELPEECDGGTTIEITTMTPPTLISSWAPADAENYIGGLHCTWTVTWNKQKFDMKVKSLVMDIEQSAGCANDYLETHAGGAAAVKTCGNSAIAETTIDSKVDNYTVSFVSDGDQNSKTTGMGFKLQFTPTLRKLPEGCSWGKECTNPKKITIPDVNKNYTITSPDRADGLDYSPGLCCQYEFSWASDKMDVVYGFLGLFETEGNGTDCERDYVAVTDGASEKVETCGMKQYPASLTNRSQQQAKSNKLVLKFKSDNNNTSVFKGFEAMVKSVDLEACSSTKPKKIVLKEGDAADIMTPGFASSGAYGNNKNCSWEFELPAGLAFEGQFASFDLEASTGCTKDYFQLEQEGNLMGRVCGTYNYNVQPPKKGNSGKGKGRRRRHTSRWSRAAIAATAYGHPYNYPTVAGGKVTLIFVSDAQTVGKGAHFKVKLVKPKGPIDGAVKRITMDAKNKQVTITSPGYKNQIPVHPNAKAEWAIQFNKEKYSIACGFLGQFEISADTNTACPRDKLVLQDVNGTAETFCVNKTYGTDLKALDLPIKAETELSVNMTTDKATGRGFSFVCQLFGAIPPACKGNGPQTVEVTNNSNMRIQSPGYDDKLPYPNGLNCSWNIMCPNKRVVMYGDGELDLEGTAAACDKDTVTILEEKRGTDKDQALSICGKKQYAKGKKDKLFVARYNGNVSVSFVTSNKTNGLGFSLLLNCDPCSADCMGVCDGKARLLCSQYCIDGLTGKNETMKEFENVTDCGKRCIVNNTKINELDSCNRCMLAAKKSTWGPLGSSYMDCANTCHSPFAMKKNGADIAKNTTETCDQCIYGTTNKTLSDVKDVCGVCGGKGDTCLDCNQKPNGGAVIDACGKCGGDGTTCQNVPSKVIPDIIPSVTDLTIRVEGAGFVVGKVNEVVFQDATGKEVLKVSAVIENNQNLTTATFQLPAGAYQVFTKTASGTLSKKSLALTAFDSTKIKVIDLTPKEALISTVKTKYTFTFTTENVEDTKKIVCVFIGLYDVTTLKSAIGKGAKIKANSKTTLQRYVMEVPFKSATEIICELDLAIPKSRELTVFASVNGGYHPLTKTFTFPIMAPAPAVKSCKFSDSGAYVDIEFTSAVETRKLKKTSDMFDNFSVFGDKATKLNWKSVKSLRVLIGKGTSLVVIDTVVTFKANAVKSFGQQLSKALTGTEKVAAADKAKDPVAILTGATEAAGCDVLEFLGDQSYGAAGRTWKVFKFEVFDPATGAGLGPNKINITKGKLTVQGADVQTGFKVKLTVTNFLDKTTFVEVNLIINPSPIPKVSLISDKGVTGLKRSDTFSVCAEAELPGGNCKTNGAVNFVWSFPGMDPKQANARCYLFRKYTLNVGTVQLSVTLSIGNSVATVSKTLDLKVLSRPLIAVISNAPAKLGSSSKPANISCIQSIDPDRDASKKISCQWFCQTADGPCMTISDKQIDPFIGYEYTVDPTILIPNTVYTFTLKVSKGTRTASAIKEINVVAGDPPSVIFIPIEGMADSSGRLNVLAFVESAQAITSAKWTSLDKSSDGKDVYAVTELDTKWEKTHVIGGTKKSTYKMVLPPGTLNAGAKFLFSLQVLTASSDSSSLVVLETAPVITGCVVAISLAPYMESDEIELSTSECVASGAQHPLTYTFKYRTTNDGDLTLAPKNKAPSAKIPGPKATSKGKITFVSTVCDTNGNCFDFVNADVVVNPIKQDQSTLDGLVVKMMAKYLRLQLIGAYLDALVMNSNFNKFIIRIRITISAGKRRKRAISVTADGEKNAIGAIESVLKGVLSKSTIDTACQQLSGVDISQMVPADQKKFAGQIAKLLEEGAKEGISNTSIKAALNAAEDLLDAKALTENEYSAIQANAFKGLFKGGAVSQKLEVKTKNSVCTTARHDFSAELTGGDPARPVKVKFPKEMSQTYSDWTCDGVKKCYDLGVVLTHFNAAGYTRGTISAADLKEKSTDIVDVTCNNPATGEKVGVKGLTEPVEVKIPVTSGKTCKNHICKYEDQATGTWKTDGVTFGGCDGEKVICKSSHLSVFMAVNNPTPITPDGNGTKTTDDGAGGADNTGAIIGGVVGGVLAALLVGMFIFFICRIQQRDVIKVDHIEMGKPTMYAYDNTTYTYHGDPDSKVKSTGKNGEPESKVVHM